MTLAGDLKKALSMLAVAAALAVAGCAGNSLDTSALNPDPPAKIFGDADTMMSKGNFDDAAKKFESVDREHPYSPEARKSIVMAAYAYYRAGKAPEAIASAERYLALHPGTKEAPLAHHVIAMAYFDDLKTANRDQTPARKALEQFKILKSQFPDSEYSRDADNKIRICMDNLAAQEMEVGRYYLDQHNTWRPSTASRRWSRTIKRRRMSRRRWRAWSRRTWLSASSTRRRTPRRFSVTTIRIAVGIKIPMPCFSLAASARAMIRGSWLSKAWQSVPKLGLGNG